MMDMLEAPRLRTQLPHLPGSSQVGLLQRPPRSDTPPSRAFTFRGYRLWPGARRLLRGDSPVELGSRAFDLLLCLLRERGRLVSKEAIVSQVWPSTFVEESNLRFQMATLRKALGADGDVIKTVPGRGYLLIDEDPAGQANGLALCSIPRSNGGARHDGAHPALDDRRRAPERDPAAAPLVALIDPDSEIAQEIAGLLEHHGLRVQTFDSVKAFLGSDDSADVDCLILEFWLPGSGTTFQRELAGRRPDLPLIFTSAHGDVHTAVQAMKSGATDFLMKPVRHLELLDAVRQALLGVHKLCR